MTNPPTDIFGIVYIIETAQQFWSELEDMFHLSEELTLSKMDGILRRYISFCAAYHEQYLQSPLQLEHACEMLLMSELFAFHSERMCELLVEDARTSTDPHQEMILYSVMLAYGRRHSAFLRSQKRWQPLLPLLMDHVRLELDPDVCDTFFGAGPTVGGAKPIAVPIEAKLRTLSVRILYEVCRVHKMSFQDLRIFDDSFIDYLFDLVEQTRDMHDDTFNYSVIKLLVALNEQFMVACLQPHTPQPGSNFAQQQNATSGDAQKPENSNRVLRVLMSRLSSSATFGENLIFMLNRADRTAEDLCMQLLVLKLLYLLFTTKGMAEYFYTNDLCVLVDVFLREIGNIDEDNESLRHTYLRVLHPLLTKTQLKEMPYKRPQIVRVLESLIENENIRDIDPTTKRLVARCLSGEWCVQFRKSSPPPSAGPSRKLTVWDESTSRTESPGIEAVSTAKSATPGSGFGTGVGGGGGALQPGLDRMGSLRGRNYKASRSVEQLPLVTTGTAASTSAAEKKDAKQRRPAPSAPKLASLRKMSGESTTSLPHVAAAHTSQRHPSLGAAQNRNRAGSFDVDSSTTTFATAFSSRERRPAPRPPHLLDPHTRFMSEPEPQDSEYQAPEIRVLSPTTPASLLPSSSASSSSSSLNTTGTPRRRSPPAPPKRRKPPAVPVGRAKGPMDGAAPVSLTTGQSSLVRKAAAY